MGIEWVILDMSSGLYYTKYGWEGVKEKLRQLQESDSKDHNFALFRRIYAGGNPEFLFNEYFKSG